MTDTMELADKGLTVDIIKIIKYAHGFKGRPELNEERNRKYKKNEREQLEVKL